MEEGEIISRFLSRFLMFGLAPFKVGSAGL